MKKTLTFFAPGQVVARIRQVDPDLAREHPLRAHLLHRAQGEPHRRGQQGQVVEKHDHPTGLLNLQA